MWKKRVLCLVLILCAVLLSACQEQKTYPTSRDQAQSQGTASQQVASAGTTLADAAGQQDVFNPPAQNEPVNYDDGSYDPTSEEGGQEEILIDSQTQVLPTIFMVSEYAGATPVAIDPIDKPTPTPLPKITFTYSAYTASALHLTFEGPAGWTVDDSAADTYILTNPDPSMDYAAQVVIRAVPVNKQYSQNELIKEVRGSLETLRSDFKSFDPSNTATRSFIDGNGVYAAYKGTLKNDVQVAGRIMINCVNKTLYILHCSYPRGLADTFADGVYNKVRNTMKLN